MPDKNNDFIPADYAGRITRRAWPARPGSG